jgi:hypothetical protein
MNILDYVNKINDEMNNDISTKTKKKTKKKESDDEKSVEIITPTLKEEYLRIISELHDNKLINIEDYGTLINFLKTNGTLNNVNDIINICNKFKDKHDKLIENFYQTTTMLFEHLFDKPEKNIYNGLIIDTDTITKKILIEKNEIELTDNQKEGLRKTTSFLLDNERSAFGLYGYAGTGKTTLITEMIYSLLKNNYINSIAFTAPTHKAVNIMKSKFRHDLLRLTELKTKKPAEHKEPLSYHLETLRRAGITIEFTTIHGLLNYTTELNTEGVRTFSKGESSKLRLYNMVIIDECSMIPIQIMRDIIMELYKKKTSRQIPKLIFVGDPAQLPPVNEILSSVFINKHGDIDEEIFKRVLENDNYDEKGYFKENKDNSDIDKIKEKLMMMEKGILNIETFTLKTIIRSKNTNIIGLNLEIRDWIMDVIKKPILKKFQGEGVHIFNRNGKDKLETKWLKLCIDGLSKKEQSNIILTWTNRQSDDYNSKIRQTLFSKTTLNRFEVGDILMLNDFYNIDEVEDKKKTDKKQSVRFYTSEQIKIKKINETTRILPDFSQHLRKNTKNISEFTDTISNLYAKSIRKLNKKTKKKFNCYQLKIIRLNDNLDELKTHDEYYIYVINESDVNLLEETKMLINKEIKQIKHELKSLLPSHEHKIDDYIIRPLWMEYNRYYLEPFANVSYGYSTTVHKSQGSTYYNVFIDVDDINLNKNKDEMKRCVYTAFTRASNEIYLLF